MSISIAATEEDILATYPLMKQLRPHLEASHYSQRIRELQADRGYHLAVLVDEGSARACAGFRLCDSLAWGRHLYVDDLITDEASRGKGYAGQLFDWLEEEASRLGCAELHLDSGVHRHDAHRFYLNRKMNITCHHFAISYDRP
ncbi:GNAT family N-acetyltransferase [Paenibacillus sp. 1P07SE]|uniref:GNAT family N-acetyltransferase n=1 Tax=Paenibacillus sp. 1P07SE TaxID=3132209 RepID=UPI0039A4BC3A